MKSKDNVKDKITLDSIDKRLETIEKKIKTLPDKRETKNYFDANLMFSLAFVLFAVAIPLIIQLQGYTRENLLAIVITYAIFIFGFFFLAKKFLDNGQKK